MTHQIQTSQFITLNALKRGFLKRAQDRIKIRQRKPKVQLKFKDIDATMMSQAAKLRCFHNGSYTRTELTEWLHGKPAVPGWYDTMSSGQTLLDRMYNNEDGCDSDPMKATIIDPIAGRRYWDGKRWSEPLVYWAFLSEDNNNFDTAERQKKPQRASYQSWKAPAVGAILHHKYIVYRGLTKPPESKA